MFTARIGGRLVSVAAATALAVSILPVAAGSASAAVKASCPSCGHNLIANPGAEKGKGANSDDKVKVPHWTQTGGFTATLYTWSGGDVNGKSPGPKTRGKNYFYGGPDAAKSTGTQTVTIAAAGISGGKAHFTLSGWLGGFSSQGDHTTVTVSFDNSHGKVLATASIGPVTAAQRKDVSKFLLRSKTGTVPGGTRNVQIKVVMTRTDGSDNDGLADNLSLVFKN